MVVTVDPVHFYLNADDPFPCIGHSIPAYSKSSWFDCNRNMFPVQLRSKASGRWGDLQSAGGRGLSTVAALHSVLFFWSTVIDESSGGGGHRRGIRHEHHSFPSKKTQKRRWINLFFWLAWGIQLYVLIPRRELHFQIIHIYPTVSCYINDSTRSLIWNSGLHLVLQKKKH